MALFTVLDNKTLYDHLKTLPPPFSVSDIFTLMKIDRIQCLRQNKNINAETIWNDANFTTDPLKSVLPVNMHVLICFVFSGKGEGNYWSTTAYFEQLHIL